jgi:hypothetical protein
MSGAQDTAALRQRTDELAQEVVRLRALAVALERWHQDMISMMAQHRDMNAEGEDMHSIARQLIMVSLNAAIEGARAGNEARGFVAVAAEVKTLALRVQVLAGELGRNLHTSSLITTATFQDIQAAGKMMMAAISALEGQVRQLRAELG